MTHPEPGSAAQENGGAVAWARTHATALTCVIAALGVVAAFVVSRISESSAPAPLEPVRYVGIYERDAPASYTGIDRFAQAIGKQPDMVCYYSLWVSRFRSASPARPPGMAPCHWCKWIRSTCGLSAIASGRYDSYLRSFAAAVRSYHHRVILGFGHEMNGWWFTWGYQQASPASFVAAWRHIVTLFRAQGAQRHLAVDGQHHQREAAASIRPALGGLVTRM